MESAELAVVNAQNAVEIFTKGRKAEEDARITAERLVIEQAQAAKKEQDRLTEFAEKARIKADSDLKAAQDKALRDAKAAADAAVIKERERAEKLRIAREQRRPSEILCALKAVCDGYDYNPGDSDLDDEQRISVWMTLGDYRRASRLRHELDGK